MARVDKDWPAKLVDIYLQGIKVPVEQISAKYLWYKLSNLKII